MAGTELNNLNFAKQHSKLHIPAGTVFVHITRKIRRKANTGKHTNAARPSFINSPRHSTLFSAVPIQQVASILHILQRHE